MSALIVLLVLVTVVAAVAVMLLFQDLWAGPDHEARSYNTIWLSLGLFAVMIVAGVSAGKLDDGAHPRLFSYWVLVFIPMMFVATVALARGRTGRSCEGGRG